MTCLASRRDTCGRPCGGPQEARVEEDGIFMTPASRVLRWKGEDFPFPENVTLGEFITLGDASSMEVVIYGRSDQNQMLEARNFLGLLSYALKGVEIKPSFT